ncbi:SDR family NAD(P)-dependent oxidoreductase [Paucibacter sp. M5-1]|uniref:SDR family NAD(P)-dependent oxidoreductase n=1 Tax=Paucibacter sp. M5-1 TaxID=3015998 RepID=UPI0022B9073B|nr:SDR family NAD(P)-dependent oxidoreductase [Paucibacter sp. M5-1]MCZ7880354.1 SDR family NAD(P)-dependent oxidoreductase [Paucibacter sp. M5-1]
MTAAPPPDQALLGKLPDGYRALVIGASGALGAAFVQALRADPRCGLCVALHRHSAPLAIDFARPDSIAEAAAALADQGPFQLIINAAGLLHGEGFMPEKRLADLDPAQMLATFTANTFGPALLLRHFTPLLDGRQRSVLALLSAKVGSIGDNRLGGWYSYRASKAALNMLVKTAAIELRRSKPDALILALHPGTVSSALSAPFRGAEIGRPAALAAAQMLAVLDAARPEDSGAFLSYDGSTLPW